MWEKQQKHDGCGCWDGLEKYKQAGLVTLQVLGQECVRGILIIMNVGLAAADCFPAWWFTFCPHGTRDIATDMWNMSKYDGKLIRFTKSSSYYVNLVGLFLNSDLSVFEIKWCHHGCRTWRQKDATEFLPTSIGGRLFNSDSYQTQGDLGRHRAGLLVEEDDPPEVISNAFLREALMEKKR